MKICLVHGYGLFDTGSNNYVFNLAKKLCRMGHEVLILCQESEPENVPFVKNYYTFTPDNSRYRLTYKNASSPENCSIFRPNLDKKLLVYVPDFYQDFRTVKTFQASNKTEIESYILKNVKALKKVIRDFKPDVIQANHCIMQPYIVKQATTRNNIPYLVTLHGSALNFSVKEDRKLHPYMAAGLADAKKIIAVSEYNAMELMNYYQNTREELKTEIKIIRAGIDMDEFILLSGKKSGYANYLQKKAAEAVSKNNEGETAAQKKAFSKKIQSAQPNIKLKTLFKEAGKKYNYSHPDHDLVQTFKGIDWEKNKTVLFVGKYLWTKGIQSIVAAIPLVLKKNPDARFIFVGFGKSKETLQALLNSLSTGRSDMFEYILKNHMAIDPGSNIITPPVASMFLEQLKKEGQYKKYFTDAQKQKIPSKIHCTGILSHQELKFLLPLVDVSIAPSVFAEAFGVVAIESLASGVFPVLSYQYGFKEVNDLVASRLDHGLVEQDNLYVNENMVVNLAKNINEILSSKQVRTEEFKNKSRQLVADYFNWDNIAKKYLAEFSKI
ncbi:glycosyltransferase family 4 protein [Patescibacteria group bacterium]|nr:glycosyltransferase family 4 protein [Patescibacteria group bacterium]MBU1673546.1 glycosyltransferase family 4 protein [Patescibacteria group bacterium]MBU1963624.1 glycosyltransferase family 4 protein [Patescibacteria group bacterium]